MTMAVRPDEVWPALPMPAHYGHGPDAWAEAVRVFKRDHYPDGTPRTLSVNVLPFPGPLTAAVGLYAIARRADAPVAAQAQGWLARYLARRRSR